MRGRRILGILIALLAVPVAASADPAREAEIASRYASEQAAMERLKDSNAPGAQEKLGEMYAQGIMTSADNPLRRPDLASARAAYQRALTLDPTSADSVVGLAKIAIRTSDGTLLEDLIPRLRAAIFDGDGEAAYTLAVAAQQGLVTLDQTPESLLRSAAVLGSTSALMTLSPEMLSGARTAAASVLRKLEAKAIDQGDAAYTLFRLYRDGVLVQADEKASSTWLKRAAEAGHENAMVTLAARLRDLGGEENLAQARRWLIRAAYLGEGEAALAIGRDAALEQILGIDIETGRKWLERSGEADVPGARVQLALLDLNDAFMPGRPEFDRDALVDKALETLQDYPEALVELAETARRRFPEGVLDKPLLARLKTLAQEGNVAAGLSYDAWLRAEGRPLPSSVAQALTASLERLADRNVAFARFSLADLVLAGRLGANGPGEKAAMKLLFDAADDGVGQAMLRLARMYTAGDVLPQDRSLASNWYERARATGVEGAGREMTQMLLRSDDAADRHVAEQRLRAGMEAGDLNAATTLVEFQALRGTVDVHVMTRAEALVAGSPQDAVRLASALAKSGRAADAERARGIIAPYLGDTPNLDALVLDARIVLEQRDAGVDARSAIETLERAAEAGSDEASLTLAGIYLKKAAYSEHQDRGITLVRRVLANDPYNPAARLLLAEAHARGRGLPADAETARGIVKKTFSAVGDTEPSAAAEWSNWLIFGDPARRDPGRAIDILEPFVRTGSSVAQRTMGLLYVSGYGLEVDRDRAFSLMLASAEDGDRNAMTNIGHMLINGYGVRRDRKAGLAWFRKAAASGNADAMYDLSRIYALGTLGHVDESEGLKWLRRAADQGHPAATFQLGFAYLTGTSVPQDREEAIVWLERSSRVGNKLAERTLRQLRAAPTDMQLIPSQD